MKTIRDRLRPLAADFCAKMQQAWPSATTWRLRPLLYGTILDGRFIRNLSARLSSTVPVAMAADNPSPLEGSMSAATLNHHVMQVMDQRFQELGQRHQAMFTQVLQHVMHLQDNQTRESPDEDMNTGDWEMAHEPTPDPRLNQLGCLESSLANSS